MRKFNITVNGKTYEVDVEEVTNPSEGAAYAAKRAPEIPEGATTVNAPMPGTMKKICVRVGDAVRKGSILCVLEAMKMENELMAPLNGRVGAIHVMEGDNVNTGTPLISIVQ